ncbi:MAG TPA: TIGR01777 family oxidoreductase [Thermoleophilia bacterium]|nr:TIGR01777 family oxidoreductase [Thermoleophilia bacterium]
MPVFEWRSSVPFPAEQVYAWHARPGAFERLSPPWLRSQVIERSGGIEDHGTLVFEYGSGPLRRRWIAAHGDAEPGRRFSDRQLHGPFEAWEHTHTFIPDGPDRCVVEDHVEYRLPLGDAGGLVAGTPVRHFLERLFRFRQERTLADLTRHAAHAGEPRLRVGVTGASGLIGGQLTAFLESGGHTVVRIGRGAAQRPGDVTWDPAAGRLAPAALAGLDAVVNLAGENTGHRWTAARKQAIVNSRSQGTTLLAETIATMKDGPRTLLSASAVGYYGGDRGDAVLTEASPPGSALDFLADVCRQWEAPLLAANRAGIRVIPMRFGVVLTAVGGMLGRVLPAFRAGAGGPVGSGAQWLSWIELDDLIGVVGDLLYAATIDGAVNVTSPSPVTNREFATTLGGVLGRPTLVPLPAGVVRTVFGEMGEVMLLGGQRVVPERLEKAGIVLRYPALEAALRLELGRLAI